MSYIANFRDILLSFDKCAICRCLLEIGFPEGYPDEWKLCCGCLNWAKYVIGIIPSSPTYKYLRKIPIVKKIEKYITLVGKNRET